MREVIVDKSCEFQVGKFVKASDVEQIVEGRFVKLSKRDGGTLAILCDSFGELSEIELKQILSAASPTANRGSASGSRTFKDRNMTRSVIVPSGVTGFFSEAGGLHSGACRQTSHWARHPSVRGAVKRVSLNAAKQMQEHAPEEYMAQSAAASSMDQRWVIDGTPFTTVTVNDTWRTAAHRDAGDYAEGLGVMAFYAVGSGWSGGELAFPEYKIAIRPKSGQVILADVHEIHGNLPMAPNYPDGRRVSLVFYLRERMLRCVKQS